MAWYNWFHTVKTSVKLDTPKWNYCNYINPNNPGQGLSQCCRFCITMKTRSSSEGFTACMLYNEALGREFEMVKKCEACWRATRTRKSNVDLTTSTLVDDGVDRDLNLNPNTIDDLYAEALGRIHDSHKQPIDTHNGAPINTSPPRHSAGTIKAMAKATVSAFIKSYKALRTAGLNEDLALNTARADVLDNPIDNQ